MKKTTLWNSHLSTAIAQTGHTQTLTIGDGGLPVPAGVPRFLEVLDAALSELTVEKIILAEEIQSENPPMWREILERSPNIQVSYVPHQKFKEETSHSNAVVRTGENTPYANIILVAGVAF